MGLKCIQMYADPFLLNYLFIIYDELLLAINQYRWHTKIFNYFLSFNHLKVILNPKCLSRNHALEKGSSSALDVFHNCSFYTNTGCFSYLYLCFCMCVTCNNNKLNFAKLIIKYFLCVRIRTTSVSSQNTKSFTWPLEKYAHYYFALHFWKLIFILSKHLLITIPFRYNMILYSVNGNKFLVMRI